MSEPLTLSLVFLAGVALGAVFFGGLWWTVRRGVVSRRPAVWFLSSLLLRSLVAVGGLYTLARNDWRKMAACTAGFFLARVLVMLLTRSPIVPGKGLRGGGTS